MLQTVVESGGTGVKAAVPGFGVAGKTGTARKIHNGIYSNKHLVASFAGFYAGGQSADYRGCNH